MQQWPSLGFGVALKTRHYRQFLAEKPKLDWLEVHTENYIHQGGLDLHVLQELRKNYPFSLHCVGLGLGSARGFSEQHLARVVELVQRVEPALVSDHLCWGTVADRALSDLLPLGFNHQVLQIVCQRVDQVQEALRRPILLENVSSYLRFQQDSWSEAQFLAEIVKRTGCGVLLDVNNLHVNYCNHKEDSLAAIAALPLGCVGEIHLAGHLVLEDVVVDDHGSEVCAEVWQLYRAAIARFGQVSSLVEWDNNIPELDVLLQQAELARQHATEIMPLGRNDEPLPIIPAVNEMDVALQQQNFADALFDADKVPQILPYFAGDADICTNRFRYYAGNQRAHWLSALSNAYPVMKLLLGEEFFTGIVHEYGMRFPQQDSNLNHFGEQFAQFLQDYEELTQYPYFPDMARLEWALHLAYYAQDAQAVNAQEIARLTPQALDASQFQLHPACSLLQTNWPVDVIWLAHKTHPVQEFDSAPQIRHLLVMRPQWAAQVIALSVAEYQALSMLQAGSYLGDALDAALEMDEEFQFIGQLQQWLENRILIAQ